MYFEQLSTPGLGCYSYAVGCPLAGVMAVIDPRRDVDAYLYVAKENNMRITHIFETHIHADHVSGAQELRAVTGAEIYIHENAAVDYEIKKVKDTDEFTLGNAFIRALHTPGHTPNSISLLISDLSRFPGPQLLLTGDLLFVGDIGRPDLPGADMLDEQVEKLYNSLYMTLAPLPDYLEVFPAHGEGSLCGRGLSVKPSTTLGYERLANPMLRLTDFAEFKQAVLSDLPMRPQSFSGIISANMSVATIRTEQKPSDSALSARQTVKFQSAGAVLLDLRDASSYGAAHIPGSVNVDFSDGPRLNWVGVAVPPGVPLVLILSADSAFEQIRVELRRIGYDTVKGWLKGGVDAWTENGGELQNLPYMSVPELRARLDGKNPPVMLDVRSTGEFNNANIDGAANLTFSQILEKDALPIDTGAEAVIICQSGFRAGVAASMLQARGYARVSVLSGGMAEWNAA